MGASMYSLQIDLRTVAHVLISFSGQSFTLLPAPEALKCQSNERLHSLSRRSCSFALDTFENREQADRVAQFTNSSHRESRRKGKPSKGVHRAIKQMDVLDERRQSWCRGKSLT